jgi:glutaredoxin
MGQGTAEDQRVVLFVRAGCHLCEEAREVLVGVAASTGWGWQEVDIDAASRQERLVERYGELVPVVTVDGVRQGYWRLDAGRIVRALSAGTR